MGSRVLSIGLTLQVLVGGGAASAQDRSTAESPEIVAELRRELEALRSSYEERLSDLERRIKALQAGQGVAATGSAPAEPAEGASAAAQPPPPVEPPPAPVETLPATAPPLPYYGAAAGSSKVFNPDIAVIGDFLGAVGKNAVEEQPGLEMHEAEASFQAIVDPYARADFFVAFGGEGVEIEEGYLTFPALPGGLLMKVGKMRGSFGKVNQMHNHVLPWTERPLVTRNLVGGEEGISDAGISLSRLFPNELVFLEATGEVYSGNSEVFAAPKRADLTYVGRLRAYRDLSESTNLDLGGSFAYGHNAGGLDSTTRLFGIDATFRYRPLRRAIYKRLIGRTELVWSRLRDPQVTHRGFGAYLTGEYQFARRWFGGFRLDHSARAEAPDLKDKGASLLLTYWPSEFSQVRGQLRRIKYAEGTTANELLFQFLFSIGAHGAHAF